MGKSDNGVRCTKCSCELCSVIKAKPVDMERHGAKLATVRIKVNNVCLDKKVAVACIIYDQCHRILAFKGFITIAGRHNECSENSCGSIERKIVFVLPDDDECDPIKLNVHTIANYIYPCEPNR